MSKSEEACGLFHKEPLMCNCAQSIYVAYHGNDEIKMHKYKGYGGGRAKDGICGALYAAILEKPDMEDTFKDTFQKQCNGLTCVELKGKAMSCPEYVKLAANLVDSAKK